MSKVLNLTVHGVGEPGRPLDPGEAAYWLTASEFETMLDAVRGRDDVQLTFDDGNASDVAIGLPALLERGLKAAFFVLAGRLDQPGFLSTADLGRLVAAGMEVGSHGMHHRAWSRLGERELGEEVGDAKALLEDATGRPVTSAACPFGDYDRRVLSRLRRNGFARIFTSDRGHANPSAWLQPRNTVVRARIGELQERVLSMDASGPSGLLRSFKLAVKRWR